jgi:hypothetical protein
MKGFQNHLNVSLFALNARLGSNVTTLRPKSTEHP